MAQTQRIQAFRNGEIHSWYRMTLGFPDHLVQDYLLRWGVRRGQLVLDPFCGAGATIVESKKLSIESVGIDANPSSVFVMQSPWRSY